MSVGYESPTSFIFVDLGNDKVGCPRCGKPMDFKDEEPVFCKACDWPDKWQDMKGDGTL